MTNQERIDCRASGPDIEMRCESCEYFLVCCLDSLPVQVSDEIKDNIRKAKDPLPKDPKRISRIVKLLEKCWKKHPGLRLCQLLNCVSTTIPIGDDLFYVEDDQIEKDLIEAIGDTK
jgi:hypothetical protein